MTKDERAITDAEWDLLEALWRLEQGTARDLAEELESERGWARSTVKTMLDRMVEKGLVSMRAVGNVHEFSPVVKPDEARRSAWRRFVGAAFGGAMEPALRFLAEDAKLTKAQRDELRRLLDGSRDD